jgi:4-oxalocrotonate tautomerase
MPIIHIHLIEGRSIDQKRALVQKVTDAVCESVNVTPDHVKIILHDMERHDYATAGILKLDEQKT